MPDSARKLILLGLCVAGGFALFGLSVVLPRQTFAFTFLLVIVGACYLGYRVEWPGELRAKRKAKGLCVGCGYDLTGNASGTCPECGTYVSPDA